MAIDEGARHRLFQRLEEVLGVEEAEALMHHLPPVGWSEVATKHDLTLLKQDLRSDFQGELSRLEDRVMRQIAETSKRDLRTMVTTMITVNSVSVVAVAGLAFAAAKFS